MTHHHQHRHRHHSKFHSICHNTLGWHLYELMEIRLDQALTQTHLMLVWSIIGISTLQIVYRWGVLLNDKCDMAVQGGCPSQLPRRQTKSIVSWPKLQLKRRWIIERHEHITLTSVLTFQTLKRFLTLVGSMVGITLVKPNWHLQLNFLAAG